MRLTALRVFGFKTFAEATTLQFEPGITALVGPNGSGKSNLVDAIRWVLGEQSAKSLRGARIEDVIFAGNERRRPLGLAEVALTFDNADGALRIDASEVQIVRRAYRVGESEFFINKRPVRLRDVVELLMGTGLGPGSYAIVSQGQIDGILAAKPVERRALFEETAGINRFLARKAESLRRLEGTEQNGIRTSDLLVELGKRVPELETQARRARRFHKASGRARDLEILTSLRATAARRAERRALEADAGRHEAARIAAAAAAAVAEAEVASARLGLVERERELADSRTAAARARDAVAEHDAARAGRAARHEALARAGERVAEDRERAAGEATALRATLARLEAELGSREDALAAARAGEAEAVAAAATARAGLDDAFAALRAHEAAAAELAAGDAARRAERTALETEAARLARESAERTADEARRRERLAAAETAAAAERTGAAGRDRTTADAAAALAAAQARVAAAGAALVTREGEYRSATSEAASAEARLHTLEELEANLEGHVPGTRAVLEASRRGEFDGIVGVVSSLVEVDEAYARALDVAFGGSLSNVVTETAEAAEQAIAFLRSREAGRATFLPLDTLGNRSGREARDVPRAPGVVGYAHLLARPSEPRFAGILAFLVGRILVVESLEVGIGLVRRQGFRDAIVTLEGDEIRGGGAMTGGRYKRERAILSRQAQARALASGLPRLRERLQAAGAAVVAAREESVAASAARDAAMRARGEAQSAERDAAGRVERFEAERMRLAEELRALDGHAAAAAAAAARVAARLEELGDPVAPPERSPERAALDAGLVAARAAVAAAGDAERRAGGAISAAREALARLGSERAGGESRLRALDADVARVAQDAVSGAAELAALAVAIERDALAGAALRAAVAERDTQRAATERVRDELGAAALAAEANARAGAAAEREAAAAGERGRVRLAEIDAELGMLAAQFARSPATAEECDDVSARLADESGDLDTELARLRDELVRLGNVNLNAEAEIAELAERETFLREQLADLAHARETLFASIREVEATSRERFDETFALVRVAFEEVYAQLFPGGAAKMWQTEAEQPSDAGIEISIQPPGKRMMPLAALSGGERAMAASALIFALVRVKPSPFYLLDEVDAALDDANVERFSGLVREVGERAQLMLVTHNKKTMELARRLYGVTMREPGISRVVAADLTGRSVEESVLVG